MNRRRLILAALVLLLAAGVVGYLLWPAPRSPINLDAAARIQAGQSLAEVEAIMGGPPRNETTGPLGFGWPPVSFGVDELRRRNDWGADQARDRAAGWESDEAIVSVWFEYGKVAAVEAFPTWREGWLKRQLNTWLPW